MHSRLIVQGFSLVYGGAMGLLLKLSTDLPEDVLGIGRIILGSLAAVGALPIIAAMLTQIRD